jgi:3-methyladenine DNA glycosylase AlkD
MARAAKTSGAEARILIREVRAALRERADPAKAPGMQAYMKSAMPYLGVQTPLRRQASRAVFERHPLDRFAAWRDTALALWRDAEFREERYAAVELAGLARYRSHRTPRALPALEEMIVDGAWWDYVDSLATGALADVVDTFPDAMKPRMRAWARSRDLWKRRSAILCQLRFKRETDLDLLYECVERAMDSEEFFLRKAIGWALREYAKTDPREVIRYVREHRDALSTLSKREAVRNLVEAGLLAAVP